MLYVLSLKQLFLFSQKCTSSYMMNKIVFCFKKGCCSGPQNLQYRLKTGRFLRSGSPKTGCFSNLGASMDVRFGREGVGVGSLISLVYQNKKISGKLQNPVCLPTNPVCLPTEPCMLANRTLYACQQNPVCLPIEPCMLANKTLYACQ